MQRKVSELKSEEVIIEINKLAKIKKERQLTKEENDYRELLKIKFLDNYKKNIISQLKNIKVVDENMNDITPEKLKKLKGESND